MRMHLNVMIRFEEMFVLFWWLICVCVLCDVFLLFLLFFFFLFFFQIISRYGTQPLPRKLRGNLLIRLGRVSEAERDFRAALEVSPDDETALCNLGCLLFCLGQYEEAETFFSRRLLTTPADFRALCNRAHTRLKRCNYEGALEDYVKLRFYFPASVTAEMVEALRIEVAKKKKQN